MESINEKSIVIKSNFLLNAVYDLSIQEQRLLLMLISLIDPVRDQGFQLFRMPVDFFIKAIGIQGKGYYKELDKVTDKLMKRFLTVARPNNDGFLKLNWLASCEYKRGQGCIELEISEKLRPYLLDLKSHYTKYHLKNVLPLRSGYSIRIYEFLKQYEKIGERHMELGELREKLQIPSNEYKLYADFKRFVILKAQRELPLKTDLSFDFKETKKGRKVTGLLFFIKRNKPNSDVNLVLLDDETFPEKEVEDSIADPALYLRLQEFGITPDQAKALLYKYDAVRLTANLDYAETKIKRGGVDDVAAYTLTIIKNDAQLQPSLFDQRKTEQKQQEEMNRKKDQQAKQEELEREYAKMRTQAVSEYLDTLNQQEKVEIEAGFAESLNAIVKPYYNEKGLESPIVKALYYDFVVSNYLPSSLPNFETWTKDQ